MPFPNLLIAGGQKCGTTWLHQALSLSPHIYASEPKELEFFNRPACHDVDEQEKYREHFPATDGVEYYLESTPHYFRVPKPHIDVAENVQAILGDPRILIILRDPVERYLSAYTHHIMRGRRSYTPQIDELSDDFGMVTLGRYGAALDHWRQRFCDIKVVLHDDLSDDPVALFEDVLGFLEVPSTVPPDQLDFRTNDKRLKSKQQRRGWDQMPRLSQRLARELRALYQDDVERLEELIERDLSTWLGPR
ncbi:sulfotransferase family protein [Euzebya tangerina]|uniref:sulfotransferase family protein n=1 Tax=Euzebya tangerina TaxID=591198 RepID=UPI000E31D6CC|nr:sulfotransferase [Euzebya tangerina]